MILFFVHHKLMACALVWVMKFENSTNYY